MRFGLYSMTRCLLFKEGIHTNAIQRISRVPYWQFRQVVTIVRNSGNDQMESVVMIARNTHPV